MLRVLGMQSAKAFQLLPRNNRHGTQQIFQPPGRIPCKTHDGSMSVGPQVNFNVEGLRTPEVLKSKES